MSALFSTQSGANPWNTLRALARGVAVALCGLAAAPAPAEAQALHAPSISAREWRDFTGRFLTADGRIIDREAGGVTHSEGQGYGMLLAVEAGDRDSFDRIWRFTRTDMRLRNDGLVSWRWDPRTFPRVQDPNNASDGDVLIAYALLTGAAVWNDAALMRDGDRMVEAIEDTLVVEDRGLTLLRPAAQGFDDWQGSGGRVVNLSYYIYPAFRMFDAVRPGGPWAQLIADGERLTEVARFGAFGLTPDWVMLDAEGLSVPNGLRQASSYDAVRIPLYLMMDGRMPAALAIFAEAWGANGDVPFAYDLAADRAGEPMREPGYRLIAALAACAVRGLPVDERLNVYRPSTYFASTLHLLAISALRRNNTQCLPSATWVVATE